MSVVLVCFTTISGVWSIVSGVAPISPVVMTKAAFDDNFTCFCYATISLVFLIFYVFFYMLYVCVLCWVLFQTVGVFLLFTSTLVARIACSVDKPVKHCDS